jgi:gluconolactonase
MGAMTTNIAFGGVNQQDLYITESETGSVLIAHLSSPV